MNWPRLISDLRTFYTVFPSGSGNLDSGHICNQSTVHHIVQVLPIMLMLLQTAQTQREDYDKLADLITETGGFLKVLQIIEKRVPNCQEYTECVTEVFTSLLVVFAVQTRFMKESRARKS